MTTLPEILKQFDEKFEEDKYKTVPTWLDVKVEKVKSFLTQTYTSMVQAEVERLEKQLRLVIKKKEQIDNDPFHPVRCQYLGQQDAIQDQINYWKNKLK